MKLDEINMVMNLVLRLMGECPVRLKADGVDEIDPCWVSYNELTEILKAIKELIYLSVSLDGNENPAKLIESNRVMIDELIEVLAWRDSDDNDAFPSELRERISKTMQSLVVELNIDPIVYARLRKEFKDKIVLSTASKLKEAK